MSDEVLSALGTTKHLQLVRGTDQPFTFALSEKLSSDALFTPSDLTTASVAFTVRTALGGTVLFTKTNAPGQHLSPTEGKTRFVVSRSDLASLPVREIATLVYEVRQISDDSPALHFVHISGNFVVKLTAQPASLA